MRKKKSYSRKLEEIAKEFQFSEAVLNQDKEIDDRHIISDLAVNVGDEDGDEKLEATIQNTLLLAQNAADQAKESSEKQAELIIGNANETAQRILDKAHGDVVAINDEYERVKEEFIKFRAKFRGFMNTQLQTFDELEKDLTKNYNGKSASSSWGSTMWP